jgi:hypothetical protein
MPHLHLEQHICSPPHGGLLGAIWLNGPDQDKLVAAPPHLQPRHTLSPWVLQVRLLGLLGLLGLPSQALRLP